MGWVVIGLVIALAIAFALSVYLVGIYNGLVGLREGIKVAWANIDVLLKQRHDELPKLVEACKRYMTFEQETLERIMRARAAVDHASASSRCGGRRRRRAAAAFRGDPPVRRAESYPELKSDVSFQRLQSRITALEEALADRRELYNEQVNLNNIRIDVFPDALIARNFGFARAHLLDFTPEEKRDVDVGALFHA